MCWPWPPLVSLMPMVLYRVVSPWWLSLTSGLLFPVVALSVVVSVTPVVRSLRALSWFTASLMLLMLLVGGVGLFLGGQWPLFGVGRWLVPMALSGRVCSRWCGLLPLPLVRVVQAMLRVAVGAGGVGGAVGVGAAGDCLVDGALWLLGWRGCCC